MAQRQCHAWGIECIRLDVTVASGGRGLEAAARQARYAALADALASGEVLVTAHHARDQAETFLLQALRGAGVAGLAAMPAIAPLGPGRLWRPWRHIERATIKAYAKAQGLEWIEDPSNHDAQIDRGYLRETVWPALVARWPAAERTLARSAAWAAQANEAVAALAAIDLQTTRAADDSLRIDSLKTLSVPRQAEALRLWLRRTGLDRPNHHHLNGIMALLTAREHHSPRVAFAATEVRRFDGHLFAMPRLPPAPKGCLSWMRGETLALPAGAGELRWTGAPEARPALTVAFRRGGERILVAHGLTRPLAYVLYEAKIPPWLRARMPLVYYDDTLVAVADRWLHPKITQLLAVSDAGFSWGHRLVGDPISRIY